MAGFRNLCRTEKRELTVLADDFGLLGRQDVRKIIDTCKSYTEGHRAIMGIYNRVYMQ